MNNTNYHHKYPLHKNNHFNQSLCIDISKEHMDVDKVSDEESIKLEMDPFDPNDLDHGNKLQIYSVLYSNKIIQNELNVVDLIKLIVEFASTYTKACDRDGCGQRFQIEFQENGEAIRWPQHGYVVEPGKDIVEAEIYCEGCHPLECVPAIDSDSDESNNHNRKAKSKHRRNKSRSRSRSRSRERGRKDYSLVQSVQSHMPALEKSSEPLMIVPCIGPDFRSHIRVNWSPTAPESRRMCHGLNIEFEWCHHLVIGQIGECKNFDFSRSYKKAICPAIGRSCPNGNAIRRFWFCRCKVKIRGELMDGTEINFKKKYDRKPHLCIYDLRNDYCWMRITTKLCD